VQFRAFGSLSLSLSLSLSVPSFVFDGRLFCIHRILPSEFFRFLPSVLVCNESKIPRHCGTSNGLSLVSVAICGVSAVFGEKVKVCPYYTRFFSFCSIAKKSVGEVPSYRAWIGTKEWRNRGLKLRSAKMKSVSQHKGRCATISPMPLRFFRTREHQRLF